MRSLLVLCALLGLTAMAFAQRPEDELLKADREFAKQTTEHRLDGWMSVFTGKSVLFSENPVIGADQIRVAYKKLFDDPNFRLTWEPTKAEVFPSGTLGYTVGKYEGAFKNAQGEVVHQHGTYLTVWRKQADGTWKVAADGGAPDPVK